MSRKLALNLESDAFNSFKTDFNAMLRKLLFMMETQEAEEGTLNVKMTVKLNKDQARDFQCDGYDGTRDIVTPTFSHKVGISMQFKDEKSGSLSGNYELIFDKELGVYVIADVTNGQTTMFDDVETETIVQPDNAPHDNDESEDTVVLDAYALPEPVIPYEPAALPSSCTADAEFAEVGDVSTSSEMHEHLRHFIGKTLRVLEANDIYTVRDAEDNKVVLSSAYLTKYHIGADLLKNHVGHNLICLGHLYVNGVPSFIMIKCTDCDELIFAVEKVIDENDSEGNEYGYEAPER